MKQLIIIFLSVIVLSGCTNRAQLPPDVNGKLEPINQTQVIDYGK
jgi:PBP1b-binding outer membrane lipoprotein LpoB